MASASMQSEPRKGPTPRRFTVIRGVGSGAPPRVRQPPISNTQVAVLVLIAFETMMFVGLVTAYLVLRTGSFAWPPPDLPRLPIAVTWVNTGVLLFSAVTMRRALSATTAGNQAAMRAALTPSSACTPCMSSQRSAGWLWYWSLRCGAITRRGNTRA
jgi:hypothetical protein